MTDGASLHYLSPGHHQSHLSLLSLLSPPNTLQPLLPQPLSTNLLTPNVVDRDLVFVPSGWDSWGKIRVLRDGFDVQGVSEAWTTDLASLLSHSHPPPANTTTTTTNGGALEIYEDTVPEPKRVPSPLALLCLFSLFLRAGN